MADIKVLEPLVADMIAAGEVVERPLNVVKELVENAIDAGADQITVEIKNGGTSFIRVTDNGRGILKEDVKTAFLSHATSKIRSQDDLSGISTLGFRGEALASIASVAKVETITKRKEEPVGTRLQIEGGQVIFEEDAGCPDGTTVIVRSLFYNVPARQKFLKKDQTEAAYISEMVGKFILSHPRISVRYLNNGKEELFSAGNGSLREGCFAVFGSLYAGQMLEVYREEDEICVQGLVGSGGAFRGNRAYECFFVNGRFVKNKMLFVALETAFGQKLPKGRFPVCALHITADPQVLDVNVHPQKTEVKFAEDKRFFDAVYWAVTQAIEDSSDTYAVQRAPRDVLKYSAPGEDAPTQIGAHELPRTIAAPPEAPAQSDQIQEKQIDTLSLREQGSFYGVSYTPNEFPPPDIFQINNPAENGSEGAMPRIAAREEKPTPGASLFEADELFEEFHVIGQLFDTYILVQREDELLLIDQHAAHERINYEKMLQNFEQNEICPQMFIEPVAVDLSETEFDRLQENIEFFARAGFGIEEFGGRSILVRHAPLAAPPDAVRAMILEMLESLKEKRDQTVLDAQKRALYSAACKASVKGNQRLSPQELTKLCKEALRLSRLETCPHGRPIVLSFSKYFIEKQFKRV